MRRLPAVLDLPDETSRQFLANADTAIALDASRHIDMDVWVRIVLEVRVRLTCKIRLRKAIFAGETVERFIGKLDERVCGIPVGEHSQVHPSGGVESRRRGRYYHSLFQDGLARGGIVRAFRDLDDAHAAGPAGLDTYVAAQRRYLGPNRNGSVEH
jgi:hypothetical protein